MSLANSGFIFWLWFALACTAHAQLFVPDTPIERDGRPAVPLPTPGVDVATPSQSSAVHTTESLCPMIQSAAADNGLPVEFFARLIWQESRLMPHAVGPLTRSGGRAQGIAQFMPSTAAERLLLDPFDPVQALPKSAEFLRQLRAQFGNLGLAAAAYNAGPQRVQDWLAKKRTLPSETRAYVRTVTGRPADEWTRPEANLWGAMKTRRTALPTEMFARQQCCSKFCELSLAHSSNMDVAISKFAFAFVAAKSRV